MSNAYPLHILLTSTLCFSQKLESIAKSKAEDIEWMQQKHIARLTTMKATHSTAIKRRDDSLNQSIELVSGFHQMFADCLAELREETVPKEKAAKLSQKAATAHAKYIEYKFLTDSLIDEIRDEQSNSLELSNKLSEYEEMIDYLYEELDCKDRDYQSVIEYIDLFYAEDAAAMVPCAISKHYVCNKDGKGDMLAGTIL